MISIPTSKWNCFDFGRSFKWGQLHLMKYRIILLATILQKQVLVSKDDSRSLTPPHSCGRILSSFEKLRYSSENNQNTFRLQKVFYFQIYIHLSLRLTLETKAGLEITTYALLHRFLWRIVATSNVYLCLVKMLPLFGWSVASTFQDLKLVTPKFRRKTAFFSKVLLDQWKKIGRASCRERV